MDVTSHWQGTIHSTVAQDGTTIGYHRLGAGPPVVLLHGGFSTADDWGAVAHLLSRRRTVYVPDRRQRGLSGPRAAGYGIAQEASDLGGVLAATGGEADVVGHSYGGAVALAAAGNGMPVRRLVLYEPSLPVGRPLGEGLRRLRAAVAQADDGVAFAVALREIVGSSPDEVDALRGTPLWGRQAAMTSDFVAEAEVLDAMSDEGLAHADGVRVPTLVIAGDRSPGWLRDASAAVANRVRAATLVTLPGQGHVAHLEAPTVLAAAADVFLSQP